MSMEDNSTTTSRRSGLRATKRIDYSSLEGGALDDHEQVITTKKKDVVSLENNNNNNNKAKKGGEKQPTKKGTRSSSLSGTEFSSQLGSPSSSSSLPIDDDGEWDDRPKQSKRRTTRTKSLSDADWDTSGTPTRVSSRSRSTPNYDESEAMDVDIDEQTDSDAEREGEEGNRSQDQDQDQDPDQDQEDMEGYDQDNEYEDEGEVVKTKKAPRRASTETYDYYDEPKTIEKILSRREVNKDKPAGSEPDYEYLVKWKSLSYLHCSYVSAEYISSERMGKSRLQKFVQKITSTDEDIEPYNADYLEVDRIIAQRRLPPDNTLQYLVKWKSLGYNEVSWEDQEDIRDDAKVEQFIQANKVPSAVPVRIPNVIPGAPSTRPPPESWVPLKESPVYKGENTLRPYQLEGLNWLVFCWYQRRNSILADEMGLGKTVQAVSTVNHLRTVHNLRGPFLVVAPLSTIPHWKREFEGWTTMNTIVYHGNSESRNMIRQHEFFHRDSKDKIIPKFFKFNVLITTFEMIMQDRSVLQPIEWTALVVDEAHRLKNKNCRLITELRTFKFSHLLLLTGTPLQNNTQELWTLLNFLAPTHFSSLDEFLADFGELKEVEQVEKLHGVLRPYLLRRMKENVERSIAPKEETIVEVELTTLQKKYYRAIYERNFTFLKKGGKSSNVPSLLNVMMELRKCCNHPYLIKGVEQNETEHLAEREQVYLKLIEASGKMVLIDKLLPKLKAGGHKVLIFSQMVRVLDILEDYLVWKGYIHERLDGRIRGNDRQAAIDRFSKPDSDRFVFLLCTRAGGLGINLTAADTVIIFDSDWNPQNDVQAQARCHRIGQEKSVKVYRLITRNTYEKHMFERASKKLGLDQAVLTKMNASTTMPASDDAVPAPAADPILDKKTIDSLLKYGAYDLFREDDTAASRFYEEDIDRILERSTVVRSNTESAPKDNALSSFSKASFVSNSAAPELDINDPDFWLKLLPQAADAPNPNIQVQPRVRRQVHRFTGAEDDSDLEEEEVIQSSDDEGTYGQKEKGWTMGERARFKLGLMTLGYGRWHEIKSMARITRWSASEIGMYGKAFVAKVLMFAEVDDPKIMDLIQNVAPTSATNEVNEDEVPKQIDSEEQQTISDTGSVDGASVGATSPSQTATTTTTTTTTANSEENAAAKDEESSTNFERDPSLCDAKFQEYLQKNAKQVVRRLETLANLRLLVQSNFTALDDIEVPDSPAPWWGAEEDRSLLLGTHKHGFGRYEEIRADPALCFLGRVEMRGIKEGGKDESSEKVKVKSESDVVKDESVKNENTLALGEGTVKDETTVKTDQSVEDSAVKSEPITEAKEENAAEITQAKEESVTETADIAMQDLNGNSLPVKQEEQIESKSVIDQPPQPEEGLPKVTPHVSVTDASETVDVNGLSWPSSKILSHRVKRILRSLDMVKRQQEKDTKKEQKVRERERKEEEKMKKKQELAAEWTKREKQDFYRALVTFGCPMDQSGEYHWGVIKEKANLKRKTADLIERYYVDFLTQCRNMISSNTAKQGEKRKAGRPRNDEDDGGMRGDDITFGQCKRVVQRIMMFSNLRTKVLPNEKLDKYLKRANKFVQLPKWWIPGTHDKALLVGIDRHGFGSWEEIVTDTALPFSQLIPNGANKKRKEDAPNTSPIPIAPTSDASTSARSNLTESNQSLDTDTAPISFEDKEERDLEDRDESRELDKDREDNKEDRDEPRDERDDERDDDEEDEDDDDDMGDSDKERDGGKGVEGGKGKRKRRNASYADIIGFPKDKVVLKRVEQLINLVLNPRSEVSQHYNDNSSAKKKQTSLDNFAKGEKTGDGSGSEKPSGRGRGRGRGGGPGSRGGGRGRGRGRGRGAANLPTSHASMEEAKQKANTISDYMLAGREEKRRKLADMDDQVMHERVIYDKPLSPPPPPPSMKAKYTPPPPPHHSTRNTYLEDDSEQYSFTRTNIFNNEDLEDDVSPPPPHLHHSHLPPRHYDSHPHHKLQNLPLPHHEPSFSPSFPPLQNYSQFHYNDNNNDSNFHFERQNKNKLPVQLPPLFPPPPMYDRSLPHERGGIPPHDIGLPPHDRNLSLNQVLNNSR